MIAQLQALQTALRNAGLETALTFGRQIGTDLTLQNIGTGRIVLFFPRLRTDSEQMTWQKSPLVHIEGTITSYAKTDLEAVQLSHNVLVSLGFARENLDVGKPPKFPQVVLTNVNMLWLDCIGGVKCTAVPAGDVWAVDQDVEMAYYVA